MSLSSVLAWEVVLLDPCPTQGLASHPAPSTGRVFPARWINHIWAACLEHHGDLTQIPSPQETQRHGFSYLVAAHNPLYICRFCHRLARSRNHDIQTLEFSMICWPTGAYLKQFHAKLLCEMQLLSQCRVDWHTHPTNTQ